ncbi:MAG: hypothetical protein OEV01_13875 [Nitrospira sp.]|nr:hypothetical protein [Nitrospira sp.]MDH4304475.1 hypothetical protein [Nitrospira sp.]MDH5193617.1 hypothetical protein [Nitrospira sp.]
MREHKPITGQILESLQGSSECEFETLVTRLPQFTWLELNAEVSRLSRLGEITITRGVGTYTIKSTAVPH